MKLSKVQGGKHGDHFVWVDGERKAGLVEGHRGGATEGTLRDGEPGGKYGLPYLDP